MRIGLIVDGHAEYASLSNLFPQLEAATGDTFLRPLKANLQPYAPVAVMARSCESGVNQLTTRGVDLVVVLLDREQRRECAPAIASALEQSLSRLTGNVKVIVKNRTFENWLVSDMDALSNRGARFQVSRAVRRSVEPNKADNVNGLSVIQGCCLRTAYSKIRDAQQILERADVLRMAAHSRSFRRFLRASNHPTYVIQSRQPV